MRKFQVKQNCGPHSVNKKLYFAGETFSSNVNLDEIFPDKIIALSPKAEEAPEVAKKRPYRLEKNGEGYDVFNVKTGKKLNDQPVSKNEAQSLAKIDEA